LKYIVKLLFLCVFVGQYSFGLEWYDFFEENGSLVYQLRYYSKLFKKDNKNEEIIFMANNDKKNCQISEENKDNDGIVSFKSLLIGAAGVALMAIIIGGLFGRK